MKQIFAIRGGNAAPLVLFLSLFIAACHTSKQEKDADIAQQDNDVATVEDATVVFDDTAFVESDVGGDVLTSDNDNIDCPSRLDALFPYYKEDGTIHFCRSCDTPTVKDPQCVRNLWEDANQYLSTKHPDYDCYPYPCDMPNLKARTMAEYYAEHPDAQHYVPMHSCDSMLIPEGWDSDGSHGAIKHWNLSEGKIGFVLDANDINGAYTPYLTDTKVFEFDINARTYRALAPLSTGYGLTYHKGHFLAIVPDARKNDSTYLAYFDNDGRYQVVYPKPIRFVAYEPVMNDKWAQANIQEAEGEAYPSRYAKVGEWKWTTLTTEMNRHPSLQEDYLSVHAYDGSIYHGYVCDLSKHPTSLSQCHHVNRESEWSVYNIQFDEGNPQRFVYTSDRKVNEVNQHALVLVEMANRREDWIFTDILTESDFQADVMNPSAFYPQQFRKNILLYRESGVLGSSFSTLACYYRLDLKKKYCMKKMEYERQDGTGTVIYTYGPSEHEGDWFLYQKNNSTPFILRDMKCYCEKEGLCPFEGMK